MRSADGRPLQLVVNALVIRDAGGEAIGMVESLSDVTSLEEQELELQDLKEELSQDYWFMGLLGKSPAMQRLYEHIRKAPVRKREVDKSGTGDVDEAWTRCQDHYRTIAAAGLDLQIALLMPDVPFLCHFSAFSAELWSQMPITCNPFRFASRTSWTASAVLTCATW
mgnify:CR=1 FL=1